MHGGLTSVSGDTQLDPQTREEQETDDTNASDDGSGDSSDSSGSSGIDWDAWREDVQQESTIKVDGEVVQDNQKGVQTEGPVDGTDPTSIYEASADELEASGVDESGDANTEEDVQEFISTRSQNGGSDSSGNSSNSGSSSDSGGDSTPSAPDSGEAAGLDVFTGLFDDLDIGSIVRRNTEQVIVGLVVAAVAAWMLGGDS